jgi:hypothetical protein
MYAVSLAGYYDYNKSPVCIRIRLIDLSSLTSLSEAGWVELALD